MTAFLSQTTFTDYLLLFLILTQIPAIFIFSTNMTCKTCNHFAMQRNPEWMKTHPGFKVHLRLETAIRWFSYLLSAVSLSSLLYYIFISPTPTHLIPMLLFPILIIGVGWVSYLTAFQLMVTRKIPAPAKRSATLGDKSLAAYAPIWSVTLCYMLLVTTDAIYLWAFISGLIEQDLATARLAGISGFIILGTGTLLFALRRKHSEFELFLGATGRKLEVRACVAVLYLGVFTGVYRILSDFYGIHLFQDVTFFIAASLIIQTWSLAFYTHPKMKPLLNKKAAASI